MSMNIKVSSLNVRGINNCIKRKKIFRDILIKKFYFFLIQEVYSMAKVESLWKSEWGGEIIFSHRDSNARELQY